MIRKVIKIDEAACTGCGLCASACHEGAIGMVNGKAKLLREDYCDGLGNCLPACPVNAIQFEEREAPAFDPAAVAAAKAAAESAHSAPAPLACGCPGSAAKALRHAAPVDAQSCPTAPATQSSELMQWPVQIKLVPMEASYFSGANLLISADCAAYACGSFHQQFMKNRVTLIGCPKLDEGDYAEKLTEIIKRNDIQSVTVIRMEVPCCGGIESAVKRALQDSGKFLPWRVVTLGRDGSVIREL